VVKKLIKFELLKSFISIVEQGSINKAAKQMFVSQPAITKQLSLLEQELNCQLFLRDHRGMTLTEEGRYLYEKSVKLISLFEQTIHDVKNYKKKQTIRIGALPSIASFLLPNMLMKLNRDDAFKFQITVLDTTNELENKIAEDQLDLAFVQDYKGGGNHLHLFKESYWVALPHNHHLTASGSLDVHRLNEVRMVLHKDPCDIRSSFRRYCVESGVEPTVAIELDFNEPILGFVANGYGISIIPEMVAKSSQDESITFRKLEPDFTRDIGILYHPDFSKIVKDIQDIHENGI
jgi:DNA-binding transcriptional LysR family regulator